MRSRFTIRYYNNTLSNAFKSMSSHLCTKILFFRDSFVCTSTMRLHFCISDGERQVFHGDMIIVIPFFFIFILPLLNEIIDFSR